MAEKKKDTTTFGLSSKTVARLLRLGSEAARTKVELADHHLKAEILHDRLAETLPLCDMQADLTSRRQTRMSGTIGALAGESIGALLLAPRTDIDILKRIKDLARKLSETVKSEPDHHVANTIYYAAIASALIHHGARVTTHTYTNLRKSFAHLAQEPWILQTLVELFGKAEQACRNQPQSQG
jgi:hypothetical protein